MSALQVLPWMGLITASGSGKTLILQQSLQGLPSATLLLLPLAKFSALLFWGSLMLGKSKLFGRSDANSNRNHINQEIDQKDSSSSSLSKPKVGSGEIFQSKVIVSLIEVVADALCLAGQRFLGSGLFQCVYSSQLVFSTIFSWGLLGKRPSYLRWISVLIISIGLAISAPRESGPGQGEVSSESSNSNWFIGFGCTAAAAALFALQAVIGELIALKLSTGSPKLNKGIPKYETLFSNGLVGCIVCIGVLLASGHAHSMSAEWMFQLQIADVYTALFIYACTVIGHNEVYWSVLPAIGAMLTGLTNAFRLVVVSLASSFLWCSIDSTQCLTTAKLQAVVVVIAGVVLFSLSGTKLLHAVELDPATSSPKRSFKVQQRYNLRSSRKAKSNNLKKDQ